MRTLKPMCFALACVLVAAIHCQAFAATTYTWTGNGVDSNWATSGNWDNGTPTNGGALVFPLTTTKPSSTNNLPAGTSLSTIQINGNGYNLGGIAISVQSITTANATGSNTISLPIQGTTVTINSAIAGTSLSLQAITVTQSVTFTGAGNTTANGFINGGIPGTMSLIKDGAGTLILQSPSSLTSTGYIGNGWQGGAEIKAGTLQLGQSDQLPRLSTITVDTGATLDLEDFSDACGGLAGAGAVNRHGVTNSTHLFTTGANNVATTFSGVLGDSGTFQKVGTGVLTFSGANTFTGAVTIDGGTLNVTGSLPATIGPKANGTLSGSGSVGAVSNLGGTVAPGTPTATAILNTQNVAFNGSGTLKIGMNGNTPGTGYDQLSVSGTVDITNATLSATLGFLSNVNDKFTILHSSSPIVGTFSGLSEGTRFSVTGNEFSITYTGGAGNDVVLTNVSGAVTGTIRDGSGNGVAGVSVSNGALSTLTAADGTYAITIADGPITITPTLAGFTFAPPSRTVTGAGASISGQDFTATQILVNVSGTITLDAGGALQGVVVSDGTQFATTAADGTYTISGVPFGTFTLTPAKAGFFFTPPSLAVTVAGDTTGQDFVASHSSADAALPLTIKKLSFKLNFATPGNDTFSLTGSLAVPTGFSPAGQQVQLLINNITKTFTLDAKGNAKSGADSFKLALKIKKGVVAAQTAAFAVKGGKGDYVSGLAGTGIANVNAKSMSVTVPVLLIFNNSAYGKNQPQVFSAKAGKSGSTK